MSRSSKNNVVITADSLIAPFSTATSTTASPLEVKTHPSTPTPVVIQKSAIPEPVVADQPENISVKPMAFDIKKIKGELDVTFAYVQKHGYICINVNGHPVEKIDITPFKGNEDRIYRYANAKCEQVKAKFLAESK